MERDLELLVNYTDSFKAKMVQRLSAPNAISAIKLSKEVGVSQSQLSRWLRVAPTVDRMTEERPSERAVQTGSTRSAHTPLGAQAAYDACWLRHRCLVVRGGVFYKCTRAAYQLRKRDVEAGRLS